jgi:hypothetical protein
MLVDLHQVVRTVFSSSDPSAPNAGMFLLHTSGGHGDGVPADHGDARGILEKRDTTPATV